MKKVPKTTNRTERISLETGLVCKLTGEVCVSFLLETSEGTQAAETHTAQALLTGRFINRDSQCTEGDSNTTCDRLHTTCTTF